MLLKMQLIGRYWSISQILHLVLRDHLKFSNLSNKTLDESALEFMKFLYETSKQDIL